MNMSIFYIREVIKTAASLLSDSSPQCNANIFMSPPHTHTLSDHAEPDDRRDRLIIETFYMNMWCLCSLSSQCCSQQICNTHRMYGNITAHPAKFHIHRSKQCTLNNFGQISQSYIYFFRNKKTSRLWVSYLSIQKRQTWEKKNLCSNERMKNMKERGCFCFWQQSHLGALWGRRMRQRGEMFPFL